MDSAKKDFTIAKEQYIALCAHRREKKVKDLIGKLEDQKKRLGELQKAYINLVRAIDDDERNLGGVVGDAKKWHDLLAEEFADIVAMEKVIDIEIDAPGQAVSVFTNTLFCQSKNTGLTHELGKFRIEFDLRHGGVRWFNLTRHQRGMYDNMNAPHVYPNGGACLGNAAVPIAKALASYSIIEAITVAIAFVETATRQDESYYGLENWPLVKEKKQRKKK